MVTFLWRERTTDKVLQSGFFTLFILTSVAGCAHIIISCLLANLPHLGALPALYLSCTYCPGFMYKSSNFLGYIAAFGNTAIALNRLTCFGSDGFHARLWEGRGIKLIVLLLVSAAFLLISCTLPAGVHYANVNGTISVSPDGTLAYLLQIHGYLAASTYCVCAVLDLLLSILAVVRIRGFGTSAYFQTSHYKLQTKLLTFSIYMSILMLFRTLYSLSAAFDNTIYWLYVAATVAQRPVLDLYSLSGSVFLLCVSADVRQKFVRFYGIRKRVTSAESTLY